MVDDDFLQYARDSYSQPIYTEREFKLDLSKVIVLKKMFRRYILTGDINERIALNNITIMLNVFGIKSTNVILFYKLDKELHGVCKTFLAFLDSYVSNYIIDLVEFDTIVISKLEELKGYANFIGDDV